MTKFNMLSIAKKLLLKIIPCVAVVFFSATVFAGMISLEKEIELGRKTGEQLEAQYGVVADKALQKRVDRIGQRLARVCGRDEIKFSFKVLNSKEINALACPGGFVYVFKGLIDYMPSDTELAGVLGHEVGHVAKKHTVHSIEKNMWSSLGAILVGVASGSMEGMQAAMVGMTALQSGFSRTDERGADKEGVNNTVAAGFNPYAMLITAHKLEDLQAEQQTPNYGLFNSHPEPEERIKRVLSQIAKLKVTPNVIENNERSVTVQDGKWTHDINIGIGNTKPLYRGYMLAGSMWVIKRQTGGVINPSGFYVVENGSRATIYYGDTEVYTCYNADGRGAGIYARELTTKLRNWANLVNSGAISTPLPDEDKKSKKKDKKKK
ncbi:MAG: M48 family metalloprotease [Phascolarctobacterium sp.]|nr:M48 family metalloprotease [Candidatus Phascolarctobacterium caballi]